jgi:hypothetical protein
MIALDPGILFALAVVLFIVLHPWLKWPLPVAFLVVAAVSLVLGGYLLPLQEAFRQYVEGGFGFINLVLVLFAGAFFGHMMRFSGAADAVAAGIVRAASGNVVAVLVLVSLPIYVVGMFVGLAGVGVLAAGVFAVPALRRIGYDDPTIAAFIAVLAVSGMIAPPTNVPAMLLADGVNMPWTGVAPALLALSIPLAVAAVVWFAWVWGPTGTPAAVDSDDKSWSPFVRGMIPLAVVVILWVGVRALGEIVIDPVSPLILVIGGLVAVPLLPKVSEFRSVVLQTFTGTPLFLAAVLVSVGILVQIMTLTGVRGWLVISIMSLESPWNYPSLLIGLPLIGGALTSIAVSDVVGVPAAFSFIGQNMILNVAALSSIAMMAEFVPPTSVSAALSCYIVGGTSTVGKVFRRAWPPMAFLVLLSLLMLLFAPRLAGILV